MWNRFKEYCKNTGALAFAAALLAAGFILAKLSLIRALFQKKSEPTAEPVAQAPTGLPPVSEDTQEVVRSVETTGAAERAEASAKAEEKVGTLADVGSVTDGAARRGLLARLLRKS